MYMNSFGVMNWRIAACVRRSSFVVRRTVARRTSVYYSLTRSLKFDIYRILYSLVTFMAISCLALTQRRFFFSFYRTVHSNFETLAH